MVNTPGARSMALSKKARRAFYALRGHGREEAKESVLQPLSSSKTRPARSGTGATGAFESRRRVKDRVAAIGKRQGRKMGQNTIQIHDDTQARPHKLRKMDPRRQVVHVPQEEDELQEMQDEDTTSEASVESEEDVEESVAEDMRKLEESFKGISQKYRLINRIGEGTFSTVYKAEELDQDDEDVENQSSLEMDDLNEDMPPTKRRRTSTTVAVASQSSRTKRKKSGRIVALKKIYVTSSPHRIANELELLHILRDAPYICPLLNAFRHLDQVVIVLPYFKHLDFRLYYRDFMVSDIRYYFNCLLHALHHVHKAGILHRDIKPTNFLYDNRTREGTLVDFGLAEKQGTDWQPCLCLEHAQKRHDRFMNSFAIDALRGQTGNISASYPNPKSDPRSSRRANRAGTRGFRAPEVLLKCTAQTTKIDIWSVGVILLTILAQRFPFFNSADDVDAMIEISSIFGKKRMKTVAALHGSIFETNLDTVGDNGFPLERIIAWASCKEKTDAPLRAGESQGIRLLEKLLELDPNKRMSAKQALQHEFFKHAVEDEQERAERIKREEQEEQDIMMQR